MIHSMTATLLFALFASVPAAAAPIVIDGRFDDWADVALALDDPADAPGAPVDFGELRVTHDDRFVHLLIDVTRAVNVQRLNGRIDILFDVDADENTGRPVHGMPGVDLIVELSPRDPQNPDRAGRGAAIAFPHGDRKRLSPYLIGLTFAPTYASDAFELRMERGATFPGVSALFESDSFRGRLVYLDRNDAVLDDTRVFAYDLTPVDPVPSSRRIDPLRRPAGTHLRVMTWNIGIGGLRSNPASFERILHALDPDVILLQELTEDDDPQRLAALLTAWITVGGDRWTVLRGSGGGRLRCAVASRLKLSRYAALDPLPMPDRADRSVRVMGAELTLFGHRLLMVSAHLRCCGGAGSFEDRTRIVEADAIRRAIAEAVASGRFDGVIVGGDLNLVGSRWPLDVLAENLQVVEPLQIGGRSNTTWWDNHQPFLPGRLDFVLVTKASLSVRRSFVLDTRLLKKRWLLRHGLRTADTVGASDHLPVVVDLRRVARPSSR